MLHLENIFLNKYIDMYEICLKKKLQLASFSNSTVLNLIEKFDEKIRNRRNCLKTFLLHGEWKFNEKFCFFFNY